MSERRYVIERLVRPDEFVPVSNLMSSNGAPLWKETDWEPHEVSLSWLKRKYGYEYRLVRHGR